MLVRRLSLVSALLVATVAHASPVQFTATFTPTLNLHAIRAYAAYGAAQWSLIGSLDSAVANVPSVFTATTAANRQSDGRFALVGIYTIPPTGSDPMQYKGVSVVMTSTNAAYALDDGAGHARPFFGTDLNTGATGVFPDYQESIIQGYLEGGGTGMPYVLNNYDLAGKPNRYIVGSGSQSIVNFSTATAGGTATISVVPVPEPASFAALGLGLLALRRRYRSAG